MGPCRGGERGRRTEVGREKDGNSSQESQEISGKTTKSLTESIVD